MYYNSNIVTMGHKLLFMIDKCICNIVHFPMFSWPQLPKFHHGFPEIGDGCAQHCAEQHRRALDGL